MNTLIQAMNIAIVTYGQHVFLAFEHIYHSVFDSLQYTNFYTNHKWWLKINHSITYFNNIAVFKCMLYFWTSRIQSGNDWNMWWNSLYMRLSGREICPCFKQPEQTALSVLEIGPPDISRSLMKVRPCSEHLTSLPKRGGTGALLSISAM